MAFFRVERNKSSWGQALKKYLLKKIMQLQQYGIIRLCLSFQTEVIYVPSIQPLWTLCLLTGFGSERLISVGENIFGSLFRKEGKDVHLSKRIFHLLTSPWMEFCRVSTDRFLKMWISACLYVSSWNQITQIWSFLVIWFCTFWVSHLHLQK